ncbi:hypothetical protein D3C71_1380500 [compost metagenome]
MLAILIVAQGAFHLVDQQHIVNALATVTRLGANLLAIGDVLRHRIAVEPHLALHRIQIGTESKLMQHREDVLFFQSTLRVVVCPTLAHKHTAQ